MSLRKAMSCRKAAAACAVLLLVAVSGCGGGSAGHAESGRDGDPAPADAVRVVRAYVEAANRLDVDALRKRRCADARIAPGQVELFRQQLHLLQRESGSFEPADLKGLEAPPLPDVGSVKPDDPGTFVRYHVKGPAITPSAFTLTAKVHNENGHLCVSGVNTSASDRIGPRLPRPPSVSDDAPAGLDQLAPMEIGDGFEQVSRGPAPVKSPDVEEAYQVSWSGADGRKVTLSLGRTADDVAASAVAQRTFLAPAGDSTHLGTTPELKLPLLTYLGYAWLWVQMDTVAPLIDRTVVVLGPVVATVDVVHDVGQDDGTLVDGIIAHVMSLAHVI